MANKGWICRIHGEGFTVDFPCTDELDAEAKAYTIMSEGVRHGNKIYPNRNIVYCELVKKADDAG